jgi:MFS family permease
MRWEYPFVFPLFASISDPAWLYAVGNQWDFYCGRDWHVPDCSGTPPPPPALLSCPVPPALPLPYFYNAFPPPVALFPASTADCRLLGYLCDIIGPRPISLLSSLLFTTAYLLASQAFLHRLPLPFFLVSFFLVGMGTSSMYFSALTTSAKNFVGHRGLSIGIPIAAFGLSSFWEAQLAGSKLFTKTRSEAPTDNSGMFGVSPVISPFTRIKIGSTSSEGELDVPRLFYFFAILLGAVGIIGSLGLVSLPQHLPKHIPGDDEPTEQDALLRPALSRRPSLLPRAEQSDESETSSVISVTSAREELDAEERPFLRDSSTWVFGVCLLVLLGSGEMFINCVRIRSLDKGREILLMRRLCL